MRLHLLNHRDLLLTTFLLSFFALLLTLSTGVLPAQAETTPLQDATTPSSDAPKPTRIESLDAIAPTEVASEGIAVERELRSIDQHLKASREVRRISEQAAPFARKVESIAKTLDRDALRHARLREVEEIERQWKERESYIQTLHEKANKAAATVEADHKQLRDIQEQWQKTQKQAIKQKADAIVLKRIQAVLAHHARAHSALMQTQNAILALQDGLSSTERRIGRVLDQTNQAIAYARARIWTKNWPAFWEMGQRPKQRTESKTPDKTAADTDDPDKSISASTRSLWSTHSAPIPDFFKRYQNTLEAQAIAFLALLALFIALQRRLKSLSEAQSSSAPPTTHLSGLALAAIQSPVSSATIIALAFTPVLYPQLPLLLLDALLVLSAGPLLFITLRGSSKPVALAICSLSLSYGIASVAGLLPENRAARFLWLLSALSAVATLVVIVNLDRRKSPRSPALLVRLLLALATTLLLCIALAAHLLGYGNMGIFLTENTLASLYAGFVLLASSEALIGAWLVLLTAGKKRGYSAGGTRLGKIEKRSKQIIRMLFFIAWFFFALGQFNLRESLISWVQETLAQKRQLGAIEFSWESIFFFLLCVLSFWFAGRATRLVLEEEVFPRTKMPRGAAGAVSTLTAYGLAGVGLFLGASIAGINMDKMALFAGAIGVGVGFGLQNVIGNFASGILLVFERQIQVGDTVELEGLVGEITNVGFRSSRMRTLDGAEIIVPNTHLVENRITNWTLSDRRRRVTVSVGVAYGSDAEQVKKLLYDLAESHREVLAHPEPIVLFVGFGDSSLDFQVRVWVSNYDRGLTIGSELHSAIYRALADANIEIPFPQRDLHLKSGTLSTA